MTLYVTSFPAILRELCRMTLCTDSVASFPEPCQEAAGGSFLYSKKLRSLGSVHPREVEYRSKWAGFGSLALAAICLLFSLSCRSISVLTFSNAPPCPHTELCFVLYGWSGKSHPQKLLELRIGAAYFRRARLCSLFCWRQGLFGHQCSLFPKSRRNDCILWCNFPYIYVFN